MKQINILAVIVAVIAAWILEFVWYGFLFWEIWAEGWGVSLEQEPNLIFPFLSLSVITIYTIAFAFLLEKLSAINLKDAVIYGLLLSFGFIIPGVVVGGIFLGTSIEAIAIDGVFTLLRGLMISLILGVWTKKFRDRHFG